ncbi:MAG: DUF424 family protein [Methanobacteriota archaeon]|nr:MAG: DUF424 family protein [Euryarchaeota archaeon]
MTISVKVQSKGKEVLVAAADSDLLGRTFRSGSLRIHVSREFYEGDLLDEEAFVSRLEMATVANLVGKEAVGAAIEHGFVNAECVLEIGGVPHAQMARMI